MKHNLFRCLGLLLVITALVGCDGKSEEQLIAESNALLAKRDVNGALILLKNALAKNPESANARLQLGKLMLRQGDAAGALVELSRAEQAQAADELVAPEMARALLATGDVSRVIGLFGEKTLREPAAASDLKTTVAAALAAQGQLDAARVTAEEALQLRPDAAAAHIMLARLDASTDDVPGALRRLDALLARERGHEAAGLLKGEILLRASRDPVAALAVFKEVAGANPASVGALTAVVQTLLEQGQVAQARVEFEQQNKLAPKHRDTQFLQAQFAFEDKDYKLSREITQRLLTSAPKNVRVLMLAAAADYQLRQYASAEALLGQALKLEPALLPARHLLAQSFLRAGQPEKAIEVLQPVLVGEQADLTSLSLVGEAYLKAGDSKRSEAAYRRAAKASPNDTGVRTALAQSLLASGDTGPALSQLEAIAREDSSARADFALVSARLQLNDLKGALVAIDALVKKQPDQASPLVLRGRVLGLQGNVAGATASFEQALAKDPTHFPAVAGLAASEFIGGKPELARKRFEALIQAQPKNTRARLALAELDLRLGAPDAAVAGHLRAAIKADPSQPEPHLMLVERLLADGDGQAAQAAAQDASAALPDNLDVLEALGRAQLAIGDHQRAISTLKRLASLQPRQPGFLVRLSEAHVAAGEPTAASAALEQALQLDPGNLPALRGQARLAVAGGQAAKGLEIARAVQKRNPTGAEGYALEGEIASRANDWALAAISYNAALQRARLPEYAIKQHQALRQSGQAADADRLAAAWLAASPKDALFLFYLGDVASGTRNWAKAESHYRAVLALRPRHATAMNNIAWLMATQGQSGAVAMAEQAVALLPSRPHLLDTLALALEAERQLPRAVTVQKQAVALAPKDPMLRWRLAQLHVKNGDKSDARKELESLAGLGTKFGGHAEVAALLKTL